MEPTIVDSGPRRLLGVSFFGNPFTRSGGWTKENETGRLWKRLMACLAQQRGPIGPV